MCLRTGYISSKQLKTGKEVFTWQREKEKAEVKKAEQQKQQAAF